MQPVESDVVDWRLGNVEGKMMQDSRPDLSFVIRFD